MPKQDDQRILRALERRSTWRRLVKVALGLGLAGLCYLAQHAAIRAGPGSQAGKVATEVWAATSGDEQAEFLLILAEQADLGAAPFHSGGPPGVHRETRSRHVRDTLRETALRTQAALRAELDEIGADYRAFYVVNMLLVTGDRALVTRLAARPDVARIVANPRVRQPLPEPPARDAHPMLTQQVLSPQGIEWGVARINADDVWALGYAGEGIVVAGQDTGYDWDHPALVNQYRGYNGITATHDYNWHDAIHGNDPHTPGGNPCGFDSPVPCDDDGHGTHTMGTIAGDDGGSNQIGVAPGARWIGCRNMEERWGTPATYAECFEFFLAPYPLGGDPFTDGVPALAPHVINNSWTCPATEGCDWSTLQAIVENVRAAGIVVVASAGNDGYGGCSTVQDPIAIYDAAFTVGATGSGDGIAGFSGRGPVAADGSNRLKPDVVAPGVNVRSCVPGTGYGTKGGTSMAAPHVAGTVALLWSAAPHLVGNVGATEQLIAQTARPRTTAEGCGGDGTGDVPNNVYGWGIVDALAAVEDGLPAAEIEKQATFAPGIPPRLLLYDLRITSSPLLTLTQVVLTDTIPVSTTFAWASLPHTRAGNVVTWTKDSLAGGATLTATLAVTVEHLTPGTHLVNEAYGVRAQELLTPVAGLPVEAVVPWRRALPVVLRNQ